MARKPSFDRRRRGKSSTSVAPERPSEPPPSAIENAPPETVGQAILRFIWRCPGWLRVTFVAIAILLLASFAIWQTVPEKLREEAIRKIITTRPEPAGNMPDSQLPTATRRTDPSTAGKRLQSNADQMTIGSRGKPLKIAPETLVDIYRDADRTLLQADALFAPYVAKWISVSGPVENIGGEPSTPTVYLLSKREPKLITIALHVTNEAQATAIPLLRKGDRVLALCRIQEASSNVLILNECEVVAQ